MKTTPLRLILTVALLVVVWRHSHWSVALSLTLMSIGIEGIVYEMRAHK